jgi:hypothetical protein
VQLQQHRQTWSIAAKTKPSVGLAVRKFLEFRVSDTEFEMGNFSHILSLKGLKKTR